MLLCLYSDSSPLNHDFATYLIHFACHCLTPVLRVFFGELRDCNIFRVSENTPPPPQSTSFKAPRAVDKVQKCQAEYNRNQTLSSLIHCLVCRLLFVMFTINHTCSSNTDLATLRLCFFEKDLSEVKELKGDNRVEENIWKTFKKKKKKNESSARKRSQAAITTVCCSDGGDNAHSGANRKAWPSEPQLTPSSFTSSLKRPSRSPRLLSKGSPGGQAKVAYRKELESARRNQNFSSNAAPASFFFVFSILVWLFCIFLWLRLFWQRFFFHAGVFTRLKKKENSAVWGIHLLQNVKCS